MTDWRGGLAAALAAVALVGCALFEPPPPQSEPQEQSFEELPEPLVEVLPAIPAPRTPGVKPPAPPRRPVAIVPYDPDRLLGLDGQEVALELGAPFSTRTNPPGEVWLYSTRGCSLELFFYPDLETKALHALTYQVRATGSGANRLSMADCVGRIKASANDSS